MPSTAFGPLVEPGWLNVPQSDLGTKFVNAFAIGSEINRRKQQLENQLAGMAIRERQNEMMNQFREQDYERKIHEGEMRFELASRARDTADLYKEFQMDLARRKLDEKDKVIEDTQGLGEYINNTGVKPGNPEFPSVWLRGKTLYPNSQGKIDDVFRKQNAAIDQDEKVSHQKEQYALYQAGTEVFGNKSYSDPRPFLNPEKWMYPVYKTRPTDSDIAAGRKEGEPLPKDATYNSRGERVEFERDPKTGESVPVTGQAAIKVPPATPGETKITYAHVTEAQRKKFTKMFGDIYAERNKIAPRQNVTTDTAGGKGIQIFSQGDYEHLPSGTLYFTTGEDGKPVYGVKK